jgi:hypothetical protein
MDAWTRLKLARRALLAWRDEEERAVLALGTAVYCRAGDDELGPLRCAAAAAVRASVELAELVRTLETRAVVASAMRRAG